jgi:uncharacterized protein (TIGR00251 family)
VAESVSLHVRVTPRANRDEISGWRDGVLQVRLRAPPVEGMANDALLRLLSERLKVKRSAIELTGGDRSRTKLVRVVGLSEGTLKERLTT